jgi:hypothetical protein
MQKITANDSHRFDDIADTCADAIKLALIDDYFGCKRNPIQVSEQFSNSLQNLTTQFQNFNANYWQD